MTTRATAHCAAFPQVNNFFARRRTRDSALAILLASVLTGCMFGDEQLLTARTGVAASFSDCVPKECHYGCCSGSGHDEVPQLVGGEAWSTACGKLMKNAAYSRYANLTQLDINYCNSEFSFEWGICVPIPAEAVYDLTPSNEKIPAGLHFNECPPSGDSIAMPLDDVVLVSKEP